MPCAIDAAPPPADDHEEAADHWVRVLGDTTDLASALHGGVVHPSFLRRLRVVAPEAMALLGFPRPA